MDHPALTICVFCSSSEGIAPAFFVLAEDLGCALAERGHQLVYGGASVGLMGTLARSMKRHGGRVVGVIPAALEGREIAFTGADELIVTRTCATARASWRSVPMRSSRSPAGSGRSKRRSRS